MKNKNLLIVLIVVVVVVLALVVYFSINSASKVDQTNANQMLIGGQKDAHGCLIAAGYSWCEPKQKCLRIWEERCYINEDEALTRLFAAEHNKPVSETFATVARLQNNYASGSIKFGSTEGEGGAFLARFVNNAWIIDYEGNGSIDCEKIEALGYPQEVLEGFCD